MSPSPDPDTHSWKDGGENTKGLRDSIWLGFLCTQAGEGRGMERRQLLNVTPGPAGAPGEEEGGRASSEVSNQSGSPSAAPWFGPKSCFFLFCVKRAILVTLYIFVGSIFFSSLSPTKIIHRPQMSQIGGTWGQLPCGGVLPGSVTVRGGHRATLSAVTSMDSIWKLGLPPSQAGFSLKGLVFLSQLPTPAP